MSVHSRVLNNKINGIHERALRLVYSDNVSSFDKLLKKGRSLSIHHRNIQSRAIEIYKLFHGLSPSIMKKVFHLNSNNPYKLYCKNPKTIEYGKYEPIKISKSLDAFKSKIRQWEPDCPCRLC